MLSGVLASFSTEFSTAMLKNYSARIQPPNSLTRVFFLLLAVLRFGVPKNEKPLIERLRLTELWVEISACHFLQQLLIDVKVRVHVLYIVMLLQGFDQAD